MLLKGFMVIFLVASVEGQLVPSFNLSNKNNFHEKLNRMKRFYCEKAIVVDLLFDNDSFPFDFDFFESCTCFRSISIIEPIFMQAEKKRYNFIVLDNFHSFELVLNNLPLLNFDRSGFFSVIFKEIDSEELNSVLQLSWKSFMHNVNVIDISGTHWTTFEPFLDKKVRVKMTDEDFFPNKLRNLNKRPLRVPVLNYWPGLEFNNNQLPSGIEGEILTQLSFDLNFTILPFNMENEDEKWGSFSN